MKFFVSTKLHRKSGGSPTIVLSYNRSECGCARLKKQMETNHHRPRYTSANLGHPALRLGADLEDTAVRCMQFRWRRPASRRSCPCLSNAKFALQLLERDPFRLRINEQHNKELQRRHGREECERQPSGIFCKNRKKQRDECVHDPVRG
jgi:hypothetical protein